MERYDGDRRRSMTPRRFFVLSVVMVVLLQQSMIASKTRNSSTSSTDSRKILSVKAFAIINTVTSTRTTYQHQTQTTQLQQLQQLYQPQRIRTLRVENTVKTANSVVSLLSSFSSSSESQQNSRNDSSRQQQQQQQKQPSSTSSSSSSSSTRGLSNQQGKRELFQSILEPPPNYSDSDIVFDATQSNIIPVLDDSVVTLMHCIVRAADGRKAENIVALYVAHLTTMTSVLVVVSGNSRPQNQAICAAIRTAVSDLNQNLQLNNDDNDSNSNSNSETIKSSVVQYAQPGIEGSAESGWMILDYGSVMVHVMTPKSRLFYNIEGKWKQPQPMTIVGGAGGEGGASSSSSSETGKTTTVMTTALPLDISQSIVPNTASVSAAMQLQQQQQRIGSMDGMEDEDRDDFDTTNESTITDDEEVDNEDEEVDPFWS
jgi:ribosome-associated protein